MHTHYTLEEASNPPKERGHYVVLRKNGLRVELEYYPDDNDWSAYTDVIYWYRPLTEEERAKEMGEFAEWATMSGWIYYINGNAWVNPPHQKPKSTAELFALFTQEREKQKQQKGESSESNVD